MKILSNKHLLIHYIKDIFKIPSRLSRIDSVLKVEILKQHLLGVDFCSYVPFSVVSDVVVSLTTYGSNIHNVHFVIRSLMYQTVQAKKIVLWLDEDEFNEQSIPYSISCLVSNKFEVRFCANLRSYKKMMPSIKVFRDYDIITVDDDYIYPRDTIEMLAREREHHENVIISHRAHRITISNDGSVEKYNSWKFEISSDSVSHDVFVTTGGGTLFPKNIFEDDFVDSECYMRACPTADDVWVNFYAIKNGIKRKKVSDVRKWSHRFLPLDTEGTIPLSASNVAGRFNDKQIGNIIKHFSIDINKIKHEES